MTNVNTAIIQKIKDLRMQRKTTLEICAELEMSYNQVMGYVYRHNIPRVPRDYRTVVTRGKGRISVAKHLTHSELMQLDALADKWGCDTLAEAAIEILKDALAEANE